jgi:phospholipid/cholesterol/gamma-HCH transport system ATP-binding protein
MIEVAGLHKSLGGHAVLRGVSFTVAKGECVALVGPSGTGKSVLLKHIIGLVYPDAGRVAVAGTDVPGAGRGELLRLRRRMGYAFQDAALLDSLSVRDNLRLALDPGETGASDAAQEERVLEVLATVNLDAAVLDRRPAELSGGMRKRVGVARAVINRPDIVLYDEPTTGLDPRNADLLHGLIRRINVDRGVTSLVVTHDIAALPAFASRVVCLAEGRVAFDGPTADFTGEAAVSIVNGNGNGNVNGSGNGNVNGSGSGNVNGSGSGSGSGNGSGNGRSSWH